MTLQLHEGAVTDQQVEYLKDGFTVERQFLTGLLTPNIGLKAVAVLSILVAHIPTININLIQLITIYLQTMNETQIANTLLTYIQGSPNTFSFIALGIFCLGGYLASIFCMKCLKKMFGNVKEGLSEEQIREIVQQEKERRMKRKQFTSGGKATLSKAEQEQIEKRVQLYKAKIQAMMAQNKDKKTN